MNYYKIGIILSGFFLSATLSFAQSEPAPVIYGDKGGPEEVLVNEEVQVMTQATTADDVFPTISTTTDDDTKNADVWYWTAGVLVLIGGGLLLAQRGKNN